MVEEKVVKAKICNKCHKRIECPESADWVEWQEFLLLHFTGGYDSIWGDESNIEIDLCQKCAFEVLSPFALSDGLPVRCPKCNALAGYWEKLAETDAYGCKDCDWVAPDAPPKPFWLHRRN